MDSQTPVPARPTLSLFWLLMAFIPVGLVLAYALQPGPAGPGIVSSLAGLQDGALLAVARLDETTSFGRRKMWRTISVVDVAAGTTKVVVDHDNVDRNTALVEVHRFEAFETAVWAKGDELVLRKEGEWQVYRPSEAKGYKHQGDKLFAQSFVAFSRAPHTYLFWDAEMRAAIRYITVIGTPAVHQQLLARSDTDARRTIQDADMVAIDRSRGIAFAPRGHVVAVQHEGTLRVCDFDRQVTATFPCATAERLAFSTAGSRLALATKNVVWIVDVATGEQLASHSHPERVAALAWAGSEVAIGDFAGGLTLWDPASTGPPRTVAVAGLEFRSEKPILIVAALWLAVCTAAVVRGRGRRLRTRSVNIEGV